METGPRASGTLAVPFSGKASEKGLVGLYRSRYGTSSILTAQCQPTGTRRLFPCLDRPDRKAPITVEVRAPTGVEVIFNTPETGRVEDGGWTRHRFLPTPPMATYLVYLAVGRFEWRHDRRGRVAFGVAAPPGRAVEGEYGLEEARRMLDCLERYFGIPYPLPKLDLVSVPEHAWGAMENWGAIAFREMRLLVDARTTGLQRRETLATIAHELAHQWFGNLVTMAWWTDVWLNESFASLMEVIVNDELHPEARTLDEFLLTWETPALVGDALSSTHPVVSEVDRPEEIGQAFDDISYGKGPAVLRMVEAHIGAPTFRAGVHRYLDRFQYGNARSHDLWAALGEASGAPVGRILEAWVGRPGYPLVRARSTPRGAELSQERFSLDGHHAAETWPIPLRYSWDGSVHGTLWETRSLELPGSGCLHLNAGARGFYRVLYDRDLYRRLLDRLPSLTDLDRWTILEDLHAFVLSGDVAPATFLEFADRARASPEPIVVQQVADALGGLSGLLGNRGPVADAARRYLGEQWERLGGLGPGPTGMGDGVVRERVAHALVLLEDGFARTLADRFDDRETLPPDLQGPVASALGRVGGEDGHRRLLGAIGSAPSEAAGLQLETALVASREPELVRRTLEAADRPPFNRAHTALLLRRASLSPEGRTPAWEWIRERIPAFDRDHPGSDLPAYIIRHALPLVGLGRVAEVEEFCARTPLPNSQRAVGRSLALLNVYEGFVRRARAGGRETGGADRDP